MLRNTCQLTLKLCKYQQESSTHFLVTSCLNKANNKRWLSNESKKQFKTTRPNTTQKLDEESTEIVKVEPKQIFQKEFPEFYHQGEIMTRISYVDFVDQALEKIKDLGLERDLEAYKELMRVFPPGRYCPKSSWDLGIFHAPQQLCAIRLLMTMESYMVKPDKELERIVIAAFSKHSEVWKKLGRSIYWSMKGRNIDLYPLPEKIPKETHEIAKVALMRMLDDPRTVISVRNTSSLPDVVDKTWIVFSQSPLQQSIIDKLDKKTILYIEQFGSCYVADKYLSYFVMKLYEDEETVKRRNKIPEPNYDYNSLEMRFYGKPIREKLIELEEENCVDDGQILGIAITGTSSHDSALSWLKLMQQRNPNLKNLNVVFRLERPVHELIRVNESKWSDK